MDHDQKQTVAGTATNIKIIVIGIHPSIALEWVHYYHEYQSRATASATVTWNRQRAYRFGLSMIHHSFVATMVLEE